VTAPRIIPSIEHLRQQPDVVHLEARYGATATLAALRDAAADLRRRLEAGALVAGEPDTREAAAAWLAAAAGQRLDSAFTTSLRPVINATGVIVHTNLGRAPICASALERVVEIGGGYSNLEYDLGAGARGRRDVHAEALITRLTGAAAAVVVNNNAAATMLALAALARGREVIISRGELIEIGGGFRVPEIMAQSGAVLREVGTTNRTRVADYAAAISDRTALILRVHPSNFRIEGFAERPEARDLVALGRRFGVLVAEDLGSGNLHTRTLGPLPSARAGPDEAPREASAQPSSRSVQPGPRSPESGARSPIDEPTVRESVAAGYDVVCFSGDKLLGGPQAGILAGGAEPIGRIRQHPLMRAFRVDKLTYAALEATLVEHAAGRATSTVPVLAMIAMSVEEIEARASALAGRLRNVPGVRVTVTDGASTIGGGSAPGSSLPTRLVALECEGRGADALDARLRALPTPVIARIERDRVVLDLRTVFPSQDGQLTDLLARVVTD
jgi:L-seryl-tRNA(Ser) seleniumtransferase